jgi:hypothetical protein
MPRGVHDLVNAAAVHVDGPPHEIKRLRTLLNELLGPEHFAYCELSIHHLPPSLTITLPFW